MPYVRLDEDGMDFDEEEDTVTYTGDFKFYEAAEIAYQPRGFDPKKLAGVPAAAYAALQTMQARQFRIRYDGGHDEGFAHADSVTLANGSKLTIDQLAAQIATPERVAEFRTAVAGPQASNWGGANEYYAKLSDADVIKTAIDELANELVSCILGDGFGTGEYSMYGELTADLASGQITDDRNAPRPSGVNLD